MRTTVTTVPSPIVYVETEVIQRVAPHSDFTSADLRLYVALAFKAKPTNEAEGEVLIAQPKALARLAGLPDDRGLRRLREGILRLQDACLVEPIDSEEIFGRNPDRPDSPPISLRLLNADGSAHTVTTGHERAVVYARRSLFSGNERSAASRLDDDELLMWLLLMSGVRFPAFGGADQDFISWPQGRSVVIGMVLKESFAHATGTREQDVARAFFSLTRKNVGLEWYDLPMARLNGSGNKWVLAPEWGSYSTGYGTTRGKSDFEIRRVLVPTKHFPLWVKEWGFIEGLSAGDYGRAEHLLTLVDSLCKLKCGREKKWNRDSG